MNMSSVVNKKFCQMKTTSTLWTRIPLLLTAALLASCLLTAWMAVHGFYINTCLSALLTLGVAWSVCRYMKRTSRLMEQFIQSVRYSEFPEAFGSNHTGGHRGLPPELLNSMQEALEHYRTNLQRRTRPLHVCWPLL